MAQCELLPLRLMFAICEHSNSHWRYNLISTDAQTVRIIFANKQQHCSRKWPCFGKELQLGVQPQTLYKDFFICRLNCRILKVHVHTLTWVRLHACMDNWCSLWWAANLDVGYPLTFLGSKQTCCSTHTIFILSSYMCTVQYSWILCSSSKP